MIPCPKHGTDFQSGCLGCERMINSGIQSRELEDTKLFDWAEDHPNEVMSVLSALWDTTVSACGGRPRTFSFRRALKRARNQCKP